MNGTRRALFLAVSALIAGRVGLGCAAQGDAGGAPPNAEGDDGSVDATADTASAADAGTDLDGAHDADADAAPACSTDGWCFTKLPEAGSFDAGPGGSSGSSPLFQMTSVWTGADHQAWAVTAGGHVLHWDGASWKVVTVVGATLHSIWGTSPTDLWIAGDGPLVLHGTVSAGGLTLAPVPIDTYQGLTTIWGTSPTSMWVLGNGGGVFHLEAPDAGAPLAFVSMDLPSDYPGDYNQFRATALWGTGNDVWIAGQDQTYCDPVSCQFASELVVRKWKGGNAGDPSWDRLRIPMTATSTIALYSNISVGAATSDGIQLVFVESSNGGSGHVVRIATSAAQLGPGIDGIHQDGLYSWNVEVTKNYGGAQAIWATDSTNVWLAGPRGVRHYDGTAWQIGRLSVTPGKPLLEDLHSIQGAVLAPPSAPDMWTVGNDVALHRTVK
jgi:hypothetical protein